MSLALSTLIYEWRRYMAAVVALALSGLLVLAMAGMFLGIGAAFSATIDRSRADIMILSADARNLDESDGIPMRIKPTMFMHPEVKKVRERAENGAEFTNTPAAGEERRSSYVSIMGIDPYPEEPTLPMDYPERTRVALQTPYAVAVDETALGKLGVKLGDEALLNGRAVRIAAVLHNYPNMMNTQVVVSRDTYRLIGMSRPGAQTGPLLVTLHHPERAEAVRDDLNKAAAGKYKAWTRKELSVANSKMVFSEAIVGIILGFTAILGIGIGIGITSQTLRGAILANIKELASLRALGVSMGSLRLIVMELSAWVGVAGTLAAGALVYSVGLIAAKFGVPLVLPLPFVGMAIAGLMAIAVLSGVFSLGLLKKSQPADLLR